MSGRLGASAVEVVHAQGREELPLVAPISGGLFTMGSDSIHEAEAPNPPHLVELSPFWAGIHPVTNAEYRAFTNATGAPPPFMPDAHRFGQPDQPVVGVSYREAQAYGVWAGGSLPTEAQWELCARGFDGRRYPWGDEEPTDGVASFAQDPGDPDIEDALLACRPSGTKGS